MPRINGSVESERVSDAPPTPLAIKEGLDPKPLREREEASGGDRAGPRELPVPPPWLAGVPLAALRCVGERFGMHPIGARDLSALAAALLLLQAFAQALCERSSYLLLLYFCTRYLKCLKTRPGNLVQLVRDLAEPVGRRLLPSASVSVSLVLS